MLCFAAVKKRRREVNMGPGARTRPGMKLPPPLFTGQAGLGWGPVDPGHGQARVKPRTCPLLGSMSPRNWSLHTLGDPAHSHWPEKAGTRENEGVPRPGQVDPPAASWVRLGSACPSSPSCWWQDSLESGLGVSSFIKPQLSSMLGARRPGMKWRFSVPCLCTCAVRGEWPCV